MYQRRLRDQRFMLVTPLLASAEFTSFHNTLLAL
jgi:hypothetical protein